LRLRLTEEVIVFLSCKSDVDDFPSDDDTDVATVAVQNATPKPHCHPPNATPTVRMAVGRMNAAC
jgi:hypothetical protein